MDTVIKICTIIGAIGGIGSFGCFLIALKDIRKVARSLSDETTFGREAIERFNQIQEHIKNAQHWGPHPWEGGKDVHNMLEVKHIVYDPKEMGVEWKGCKKSVRRVYEDNGKILVEGWRIK